MRTQPRESVVFLLQRINSLDQLGVCRHRFHEVGIIGSGAFGSVAHSLNYVDGSEMAIKATQEGRELADADVKRALLEAQLLRRLANSDAKGNALGYYECWMESMKYKNRLLYRIYTSMELCHCSLRKLQVDRHTFSEQELTSVITQVRSTEFCEDDILRWPLHQFDVVRHTSACFVHHSARNSAQQVPMQHLPFSAD